MNEPAGYLAGAVDILALDRKEEQVRRERGRRDRASWYGARHASGDYGIIGPDGREVCRFHKREDLTTVLAAIRLLPAAGLAITALAFAIEAAVNTRDEVGAMQYKAAKDALVAALAEVEKRQEST